ncbi:MAG: hypothetical protein JKY44_11540 [Flavobacteriaceae bacterium]|nr:hypothetical protein [Flavobacteriaceae bacterium]
MKKILILFVMAFAINVAAQESVLLRLNYKKGDIYIMSVKISQDMGTMMSMDVSMKMKQEITSVTGDTYVSTMRISHISMDMSQGGMNMSYDSSKSDDELDASGMMLKAQMGPALQSVITIKGNTLGKVSEMSMEPKVPGAQNLADQFTNIEFPKNALNVGDTWEMSKSTQGMNMHYVYKVKSITKEIILLDVSGRVSGVAEGTITGDTKVDRNSGVPLISNLNMKMMVQGQEMLSKMTTTITKQ